MPISSQDAHAVDLSHGCDEQVSESVSGRIKAPSHGCGSSAHAIAGQVSHEAHLCSHCCGIRIVQRPAQDLGDHHLAGGGAP